MTQVVGEDFRAFVDARWPELEAVARVVVLDPELARRVTADALGRLSTRWHASVEDGRPGEDARRELLAVALAAARPAGGRGPSHRLATRRAPAEPAPALVPAAMPWDDDEPPDPVVAAVLGVLVAADPLDRTLVGARLLWDARAHDVAHLLDRPHGELAGREQALDARLATARAHARRDAGLPPDVGWAGRERDVEEAVGLLLRDQGDPPDPTALVVRRTGAVRRRHVLLGGAAAALVATGGAAAVLLREEPAPAADGVRPVPPAGHASWSSTQSWAARGPLAHDPGVRALARTPGGPPARILWAGDVDDRRVVVAARQGNVALDGTELLLWTGRRGDPTATLRVTPLATSGIHGVADLVVVAIGDVGTPGTSPSRTVLVVLAPPDVPSVGVSRRVRPRTDGSAVRRYDDLRLRDGIATAVVGSAAPGAIRVRYRYEEVHPATTAFVPTEVDHTGIPDTAWFAESARRVVSDLTAVPVAELTSRVVVDEVLPEPPFEAAEPGSRVVVVHTRTPEGALLLSAAVLPVVATDTSFLPILVQSASVVPVDRAGAPFVTRVEDLRPDVGRFLVVAPGAARVQLISTSPSGYPVSKVVRTQGRSASVVELVNADDAAGLRLVARDAERRLVFDGVPDEYQWLLGQ